MANAFRIGIVGSGPAGMACAADMAKAGCAVTVYEAFHEPGGVLKYGIPDFRLPNPVVDAEIAKLEQLGVRFECNTLVGRLFTIEQMIDEMGFHAVFIGTGAGYPSFMGIPGESLNGVLSANELLTRCNLMRARDFPNFDTPLQPGRQVAVIGAGNTAMDAMRVCLRLGAEHVRCLYRRSRAEAPARAEELHHAEQEGIDFHWLVSPVEILDDGQRNVRAVRCVRMVLGEPDESGRRRPVSDGDKAFTLEVDTLFTAIGEEADIAPYAKLLDCDGNRIAAKGEWGETSRKTIFAGGDAVTGAASVVEAVGAGRKAALRIGRMLANEPESAAEEPRTISIENINTAYFTKSKRAIVPRIPLDEALAGYREIHTGYDERMLRREADRCFSCGVCNFCDNCWVYCPDVAVRRLDGEYEFDYDYCKGCLVCVIECPRNAISTREEGK